MAHSGEEGDQQHFGRRVDPLHDHGPRNGETRPRALLKGEVGGAGPREQAPAQLVANGSISFGKSERVFKQRHACLDGDGPALHGAGYGLNEMAQAEGEGVDALEMVIFLPQSRFSLSSEKQFLG